MLGVAFARDSLLRVVLAAVEDEENERRRRGEGEQHLSLPSGDHPRRLQDPIQKLYTGSG